MKRVKDLRGISAEEFLRDICHPRGEPARAILDWAKSDLESAARFMASFYAKVFRELNIQQSYLEPKRGVDTSFGDERSRGSGSAKLFAWFCELLIENPELIKRFRNDPSYPLGSPEDLWLFDNREANLLALTRGITWDEPDFKDSRPVPQYLKLKYQEELKGKEEQDKEARKVRRKEIEEDRKRRRLTRHIQKQPKIEERKQQSALRKIWREQFLRASLVQQVRLLALDSTRTIKECPLDPDRVTPDVLNELDDATLKKLSDRISEEWQHPWKALARRIDALRKRPRSGSE